MDGIVSETINELNTSLTRRELSVTLYDTIYCEAVSAHVTYASNIALITIAIAVNQDVPAWTKFSIAKINEGDFVEAFSNACSPYDNTSAFIIQVDTDGTIAVSAHGTITKKAWYYGELIASCIL